MTFVTDIYKDKICIDCPPYIRLKEDSPKYYTKIYLLYNCVKGGLLYTIFHKILDSGHVKQVILLDPIVFMYYGS